MQLIISVFMQCILFFRHNGQKYDVFLAVETKTI